MAHKLNLVQRLLNRIGRPLGIAPFPIAWDPPEDASDDRSVTFDTIFHENWWNSRESISGRGSELRQTTKYRQALIEFLLRNRVTSMFDAPCGDLKWMREVLPAVLIRYI